MLCTSWHRRLRHWDSAQPPPSLRPGSLGSRLVGAVGRRQTCPRWPCRAGASTGILSEANHMKHKWKHKRNQCLMFLQCLRANRFLAVFISYFISPKIRKWTQCMDTMHSCYLFSIVSVFVCSGTPSLGKPWCHSKVAIKSAQKSFPCYPFMSLQSCGDNFHPECLDFLMLGAFRAVTAW